MPGLFAVLSEVSYPDPTSNINIEVLSPEFPAMLIIKHIKQLSLAPGSKEHLYGSPRTACPKNKYAQGRLDFPTPITKPLQPKQKSAKAFAPPPLRKTLGTDLRRPRSEKARRDSTGLAEVAPELLLKNYLSFEMLGISVWGLKPC